MRYVTQRKSSVESNVYGTHCDIRSLLPCADQCKCLPNLHYGSVSVIIAFRILKTFLRVVEFWLTGAKVQFYL